ncbi:hypothetical protein [Geodermatophilus amargosae]|uniref:hypothetical protein n=1 Tax=Geodermatophilus amargosae TaxID=1296565 RepID=UPI001114F19C|nr:hypothetical protein [Geodermatophilus amargosae]
MEFTEARSGYFGLPAEMLNFSTTDYLVRGVAAGIVPLIVLVLFVLVAVTMWTAARRLADRLGASERFQWALWTVAGLGAALTVAGSYAILWPLPTPINGYLLPPLLLASGPLIATGALEMLRPRGSERTWSVRIGITAAIALTLLSVFWGSSLYADALGRGRAAALADSLDQLPEVRLYSERSLGIDLGDVVTERMSSNENRRYPVRYDGLRLLLRSGDRYFLVPNDWTASTGVILVVLEAADIRIELSPGGSS